MKTFEFNPSELTFPKLLSYVLILGILSHFYMFFLQDTWNTELQVMGGPHWNLIKERNVDFSEPIHIFGSSKHVVSFQIKTTNSKLYREPYFIVLVIMKLLGYGVVLTIANLLRKIISNFEKGEIFTQSNVKRLIGINGLVGLYYFIIYKFFDTVTSNLCRKLVFPEKDRWMIRSLGGESDDTGSHIFFLSIIIFSVLIIAIKKGIEIKEEQDLTV